MKLLALDTTLGACSAAVACGNPSAPAVTGTYEFRERGHAEAIVPMIERVLADASVGYQDMDAIAATTGPGSFTGVRVGIATARGLALATDLPLIGMTSLEVMARAALDQLNEKPDVLGIAVDARRGEVYLALYDEHGGPLSAPQALTPEQACTQLPKEGRVALCGSGAHLLRDFAAERATLKAMLPDLQPDARALARLAMDRESKGQTLHPLYLRSPDAKPQTGKAVPRRD